MSETCNYAPKITISKGAETVYEECRSDVNGLPDLLKALKEFQENSNSILSDLIAQVPNTDNLGNENTEGEYFSSDQKKIKLVHANDNK
ncbi:Protein of unknown function [Gryllus bimaculatus]|nr:Protein of unknown function [Gryllus bimaculatus]